MKYIQLLFHVIFISLTSLYTGWKVGIGAFFFMSMSIRAHYQTETWYHYQQQYIVNQKKCHRAKKKIKQSKQLKKIGGEFSLFSLIELLLKTYDCAFSSQVLEKHVIAVRAVSRLVFASCPVPWCFICVVSHHSLFLSSSSPFFSPVAIATCKDRMQPLAGDTMRLITGT